MNGNNQDLKQITKESITESLLRLMETHEYKNISITDICTLAGVSRNAFYRNYPAKDAILRQYIYEFTDVWRRKLRESKKLTAIQYFTTLFKETLKRKDLIKKLIHAQLEYILIDVFFTRHNHSLDHERPTGNPRRTRSDGMQHQPNFSECTRPFTSSHRY